MSNPLVVNLFGAPGSGKSTAAAGVFSKLKQKHINCELVTEFAKDLTWEENKLALSAQPYIFGEQYYRMVRCADKVDVIITDSPLLLTIIHNKDQRCREEFNATALAAFNSFNNLNFYLERPCEYQCVGRCETAEEAEQVGNKILFLLIENKIKFEVIGDYPARVDEIVTICLEKLGVLNEVLRRNS